MRQYYNRVLLQQIYGVLGMRVIFYIKISFLLYQRLNQARIIIASKK
ncbi:hypothetical protein pb186bvf_018515 [Paramecium bursaria]